MAYVTETIKQLKEHPFPENFVIAIFGTENARFRYSQICDKTIDTVLESLTPRESCIIKLRYQECLSIREIADQFNVTYERIRQIISKIQHKMRHPSRIKTLFNLPRNEALYMHYSLTRISIDESNDDDVLNIPIDELDISSYTFIRLTERGFDTVRDLIKGTKSNPELYEKLRDLMIKDRLIYVGDFWSLITKLRGLNLFKKGSN